MCVCMLTISVPVFLDVQRWRMYVYVCVYISGMHVCVCMCVCISGMHALLHLFAFCKMLACSTVYAWMYALCMHACMHINDGYACFARCSRVQLYVCMYV